MTDMNYEQLSSEELERFAAFDSSPTRASRARAEIKRREYQDRRDFLAAELDGWASLEVKRRQFEEALLDRRIQAEKDLFEDQSKTANRALWAAICAAAATVILAFIAGMDLWFRMTHGIDAM